MDNVGRTIVGREEQAPTPELRMYSLIGAHIREQGQLDAEQVEHVLHSQRQSGLRFGDEAIRLGLLTRGQIELALRRQFNVNTLPAGESPISRALVAAFDPDCASLSPLRSLRTILASQQLRTHGKGYTLAVASTQRNDGRSLVVANLAVLFSQSGQRTLVVDADLRHPRQHELFGLDARQGLSSVLARHTLTNMVQKIDGLGPLAILPAGVAPPSPEQLLGRPILPAVLGELKKQFDVLILDTPASERNSDALLLAEQATDVLVLARKDRTRAADLSRFTSSLRAVKANVIGTILRSD